MFGLLGPNGAGKSTLMRIVAGVYEQTYGKVYINGLDTARHREELQGLIGYLPQEFGSYPNLTAGEFLDYQAILKGLRGPAERRERIATVLSAVHMEDHVHEKIGSFSGGMKQRIGIAQILLHLPRILIVDEPTAGLDPGERIRFRNLLVELGRERIVIFSTHIIEDISSSCNRMAVLIGGELIYTGEPSGMVKYAAGRVWQVTIDKEEYEELSRRASVVHHISERERINVRCIAAEKPHARALQAQPTLEDSYLCLTRAPGALKREGGQC
jgi:ABC-type multidrug transport system ATPase subunit